MRIAVWARSYPPEIGGVQTVAAVLANEWAANGHEVSVITETPAPPVETTAIPRVRKFDQARTAATLQSAEGIVWHDPMLKEFPLLIRHRRRVLAIFHRRAQRDDGKRAPQDVLKSCTGLVFRSVAVSRALARQYIGVSAVLPPPLDPEIERVTAQRAGKAKTKDCLYLGRFVPGKGLETLLSAMALLRDQGRSCQLVLAGDGPNLPALEAEVKRRGLQREVSFGGAVSRAQVVPLLQTFKVVVMPSEHFEGFGLGAVEGLACGCIPVVTTSGGLPEAVGSCGILVPPGQPGKLAAALLRALDAPEVREHVAAHAPGHLANLSVRTLAQRYLELIPSSRSASGAP